MRSGRFVALKRVQAHQLGEFEEIGDASGTFEGLVKIFFAARNAYVAPELFSQFGNLFERFAQSFLVTRHPAFFPEKKSKLSMERVERTPAVDFEEFLDPQAHIFLCFSKLWRIRWRPFSHLAGEIIWQRVWQNKITISQALHKRTGSEPVCAVIGKTHFRTYITTRHGTHPIA